LNLNGDVLPAGCSPRVSGVQGRLSDGAFTPIRQKGHA
jgi:hypothetical protein